MTAADDMKSKECPMITCDLSNDQLLKHLDQIAETEVTATVALLEYSDSA